MKNAEYQIRELYVSHGRKGEPLNVVAQFWSSGFLNVVTRTGPATWFGELLKEAAFRPYSRRTKAERLGVGPASCDLWRPSGDFDAH